MKRLSRPFATSEGQRLQAISPASLSESAGYAIMRNGITSKAQAAQPCWQRRCRSSSSPSETAFLEVSVANIGYLYAILYFLVGCMLVTVGLIAAKVVGRFTIKKHPSSSKHLI